MQNNPFSEEKVCVGFRVGRVFAMKPHVVDDYFIARFEKMAHEEALRMVQGVVKNVQDMVVAVEESMENDGKIDAMEMVGLSMKGVQLAANIIGLVKSARAQGADMKYVALHGVFVLQEEG